MQFILNEFFFTENRAVYEILCKNVVQPIQAIMTIRHRIDAICMPGTLRREY